MHDVLSYCYYKLYQEQERCMTCCHMVVTSYQKQERCRTCYHIVVTHYIRSRRDAGRAIILLLHVILGVGEMHNVLSYCCYTLYQEQERCRTYCHIVDTRYIRSRRDAGRAIILLLQVILGVGEMHDVLSYCNYKLYQEQERCMTCCHIVVTRYIRSRRDV